MNKPTKSLLLAALIALAPAAYAQAQALSDGVPTTQAVDPMTGSNIFATVSDLDADSPPLPTSQDGDPTGMNLSQINVLDGGFLSFNNQPFNFTEINLFPGSDTGNGFDVSNAELNIVGGELGSSVDIQAGSTLNVSSGAVGSNLDIESGGTANISGGFFDSSFEGQAGSVVNITGGDFSRFPDATDTASTNPGFDIRGTATISGGEFGNSADFFVTSNTTISGGNFGNNVDLQGDAVIDGGTFGTNTDIGNFSDTSTQNGNPTVTINGGTFTELDVDSGITTINGGTFIGGGTGVALAAGATRDNDTLGTINIHGGDIQGLIEGFGNINLFGTDFAIDDIPLAGLSSFDVINGPNNLSVLTGTLEDGNTIRFELNQGLNFVDPDTGIESQFSDSNEGVSFFGLFGEQGNTGGILTAGGTTINITAVPEPSSLSLLALGALGLISRRRRS